MSSEVATSVARLGRRCLAGMTCWLALSCSAPEPATPRPPTLAQALDGLTTRGALSARLETSLGAVRCRLEPDGAPHATALFVGLARGRAPWTDPRARHTVSRPLYRDLPFHRAIPGVLVQTGCPLGDGTGHPGYRIDVEARPDDASRLSQPGALVMARYTPPPGRDDPQARQPTKLIGSQFAITLTSMTHLAGRHTVIGRCADLDRVRAIAAQGTATLPRLKAVQIVSTGEDDPAVGAMSVRE